MESELRNYKKRERKLVEDEEVIEETYTKLDQINVKRIKLERQSDDSRISFAPGPKDTFLECPYDKNHLVLENRWFRHLCKCRKNYLKDCSSKGVEVTIKICKWNSGHHFPQEILELHEERCPQRNLE